MDFINIEIATLAALLTQVIKPYFPDATDGTKQMLSVAVGALLGAMFFQTGKIYAVDAMQAVIIGAASGLSATGAYSLGMKVAEKASPKTLIVAEEPTNEKEPIHT